MTLNDTIEKILYEQGIFYTDGIIDSSIIDSLQYISTIVALESEFGIEFPDQSLSENVLTSVNEIANTISKLTSKINH